MKKRLLSALLTFCMLLTLLPVSAFAKDNNDSEEGTSEEEYTAEAFAQIDEEQGNTSTDDNGNQSTNKHTVAYAIWTNKNGDYYLAVVSQKGINVTVKGEALQKDNIVDCDILTVYQGNNKEIDQKKATDVGSNANGTCWHIIHLTKE